MANNKQLLLEQLAAKPVNTYYEAPVDEPWQTIPSGSFAGSTRETGIYRTEMPSQEVFNTRKIEKQFRPDLRKDYADYLDALNDWTYAADPAIVKDERGVSSVRGKTITESMPDGSTKYYPKGSQTGDKYLTRGEQNRLNLDAMMTQKHGKNWKENAERLIESQRIARTQGFGGGFSNIGSKKVTRRPLASLSEDQILERQKARSVAMGKILEHMGGVGDTASSADRIKMAGQIVDGLFPETKAQSQKASANIRPTMNISGRDDRQDWFRGGWTKEEIADRQTGVDIDTAREVITKAGKAGMNPEQFKQLYNNMHPAVQAQIDILMQSTQEPADNVTDQRTRGVAVPTGDGPKVTLPMPRRGGPASSNELADQPIPEKGLMAPAIVGAKAIRAGAKAAGAVKDFLNSDIIPEKGFGRMGINPEANTWREPIGEPAYTGIQPQANIRRWDEPTRPRTFNSITQTPVFQLTQTPEIQPTLRSLATIGMGPGMGTRQAAGGMNDMIRRGFGGGLPSIGSGMGNDVAISGMNSMLQRGFGSTNPQVRLPDMPSMTSPDGTFLGINPEILTQFRGPAKEAVESISNFVTRMHEMSALTQPNVEKALRMAQTNTEALIEHAGGSEIGMDELIETIITTFNILESGMGPEIADEYISTYLGKSGLGGLGFETPALMER